MLYNQLKIGDHIYDPSMETYGVIKNIQDIHNILVEYDNGGSGFYCLDPNCEGFDLNLKIIEINERI